jgi:hypothetical protein
MRNARRWGAVAAGTVMFGVVVASAAAWACIAGPTLIVNPTQAKPGQEVALSGFSYNGELPIVVRFNALDGPVLGTFKPAEGRFGDNEALVGKVTIPADAKPGNYVLVATQSGADGSLAQVPVRALVTVTSVGGAPVLGAPLAQPEVGRPVGPALTKSSVGTGALVLVGLGAAGVAMLVAGLAALFSGRGRDLPEAARASR